MRYRAILFDVGGPIDLEFAWESAVDSAIASACGLEGIRVDQAMIEAASDAAVEAFAPDAYAFMVEHLCGGDLATAARVTSRRRAMVSGLDVFQMRPDIVERWGWDEPLQVQRHSDRFNEKPFFKIVWRARAVGTVSMMRLADHIRFGEFYLFPEFQRQGLGSRILEHCLALADAQRLPVRLEYLKWNPVGTLYRRHGFAIIGETEIHWLMERPAR